ncbi:RDD family protein [Sulfurovum sp. XTW-4]|uniref:RDD family protein n=1 Tax=Sulfurovum xiamenensis TaxID=3019066 RepID=A0ABT7QP76_9BACT|nr:RDD family protein [Sulfurovum xiamenensis]MDM5262873.1 RDD family protein [Sulfurovum xiamenensis]
MSESLSLPIASLQKRITSFVIDDIVITLFFIIIFYDQFSAVLSNITVVDEAALENINAFIAQNLLVVLSIKLLYHTVLIWQNGMTLGKYFMKIKVIDLETGETPGFQKAFLRASVRIPSEVLFYLGFLMAFFVPLRQTLHDKLSNCVVVND